MEGICRSGGHSRRRKEGYGWKFCCFAIVLHRTRRLKRKLPWNYLESGLNFWNNADKQLIRTVILLIHVFISGAQLEGEVGWDRVIACHWYLEADACLVNSPEAGEPLTNAHCAPMSPLCVWQRLTCFSDITVSSSVTHLPSRSVYILEPDDCLSNLNAIRRKSFS